VQSFAKKVNVDVTNDDREQHTSIVEVSLLPAS